MSDSTEQRIDLAADTLRIAGCWASNAIYTESPAARDEYLRTAKERAEEGLLHLAVVLEGEE